MSISDKDRTFIPKGGSEMRSSFFVLVLSMICCGAFAAEVPNQAQEEPLVTMKSQVLSKFLDRSVLRNDDFVTTTDVRVEYKNFGLEINGVADLTNDNENINEVTDIDLQFDYTYHYNKLALQVGLNYFIYPNDKEEQSTVELFTKASYDLGWGLVPYTKIACDIDEAQGQYFEVGSDHVLDLTDKVKKLGPIESIKVLSHANIAYGTSDYNEYYFDHKDNGFQMVKVGTGVEFGVKKWTVAPTLEYYYMLDHTIDNAMDEDANGLIYGLQFGCKF